MNRCRGCGAGDTERFLSLRPMPPVNAFPTTAEAPDERSYPLDLAVCSACLLVQLEEVVPPERLFGHYLHMSSASEGNLRHLAEVAALVRARCAPGARVLEIGSNDGSLLAQLAGWAGAVLGVDPAANLAPLAHARGVETRTAFFSEPLAEEIAGADRTFDQVIALNVVAHTPDFVSLLRGVHRVLAPGGSFLLEAAYVVDTLLRGQFDTVYHEHVYCFSLHALRAAFARAGLRIDAVEIIPTQGRSIRVWAGRDDDGRTPEPGVAALLAAERAQGLADLDAYRAVTERVARIAASIRERVQTLTARLGPAVALGAPARGVVLLNHCELGRSLIAAAVDDTPLKQGRLVPGVHVPVVDWTSLDRSPTNAFLLLAWNYREHMLTSLRRHVPAGRVLVPFPDLDEIDVAPAASG